MAENGITKSRWASEPYLARRTNTRRCHSCGMSNFSEGDHCFKCAHNPKNSNDTKPKISPTQPSNLRPSNGDSLHKVGHGLSTSRWAPRNLAGNTGRAQVWTRVKISYASMDIHNQEHNQDLQPLPEDLPYQVQHYILAMIQRILEEGCFDFAQRWIPDSLPASWDCPEAVELSKWRDFLPAILPPNAIRPMKYTLIQALGHAVNVRNKAVHRHLCDNNEIRRMALQAEDMMYMFSDVTRGDKMHHLWQELSGWDVRNRQEPQLARQNLEAALKVISERPVNDMDWTPNTVSLREIEDSTLLQDDTYGEAMDLD